MPRRERRKPAAVLNAAGDSIHPIRSEPNLLPENASRDRCGICYQRIRFV